MEKLYTGSVKDIYQAKDPRELVFEFSDRYSVFDWGEMPDSLPQKGKTLSFFSAFFFEFIQNAKNWTLIEKRISSELKNCPEFKRLCTLGMPTHLISYCDEKENNTKEISPFLKVKKVDIVRPTFKNGNWDYAAYKKEAFTNTLVPLEVIFRFGVPKGSSLLKRVQSEEYRNEIRIDHVPQIGEKFNRPIIEYSTKLESSDRYIYRKDAKEISGMTDTEEKKLSNYAELLSFMVQYVFGEIDIEVWDGKFEFAFIENEGQRDFMLVDAIGPDELRLTYKEVSLSKENMRQAYTGKPWHEAVTKAKEMADQRAEQDWKSICINELKQTPPRLSSHQIAIFSNMYKTLANELSLTHLDRPAFEAWKLQSLCEELVRSKNE